MELVKSKGMVIFLVIILTTTILGSINNKRSIENNKNLNKTYKIVESSYTR